MELSTYWLSALLSAARKSLSLKTQRSMWKTMAPFSSVMDWNSVEKGLRRLAFESGIVSEARAPEPHFWIEERDESGRSARIQDTVSAGRGASTGACRGRGSD